MFTVKRGKNGELQLWNLMPDFIGIDLKMENVELLIGRRLACIADDNLAPSTESCDDIATVTQFVSEMQPSCRLSFPSCRCCLQLL